MDQTDRMQNHIIRERLDLLRALMKQKQIDFYLVPTGDDHQSEYIGDHYKVREYLSGFTGSAGTLLVSAGMAGLWTDGRYFIQAEKELAETSIELFRMQEDGVPGLTEFLAGQVWDGATIGFDGRVVSAAFQKGLLHAMPGIIQICSDIDLADQVWKDRPDRPAARIYQLDDSLSGMDTAAKLGMLRKCITEMKADAVLLSTLDDIMWLYNLRGNDVLYTPVALAFAYITKKSAWLFAEKSAVPEATERYLTTNKITLESYDHIYEFLMKVDQNRKRKLLLDTAAVSLTLYEAAAAGHEIIDLPNYRLISKAVKNQTELELCRTYHLADAVAVTKLICWLKNHPDISEETELSVAEQLEEYRKQQKGYTEPSFETIAAFGEHAAMIHFTADTETNAVLKREGMLLLDSGGQYVGATTDITRTIVLGNLTYEQKQQYTAVVCGMLKLANMEFLYGCTGRNLDILAREPLWKLGLDYRHGTGHGVGSFLSVHEGPQAFRWKMSETQPEVVLEPGMIITDEPGVYIEGSHGIRIENELLCIEKRTNEWGRFLGFEILTHVPIDLDAILPEQMSDECKKMLNVYHTEVYELLCPYLTDSEQKWLFTQTREI